MGTSLLLSNSIDTMNYLLKLGWNHQYKLTVKHTSCKGYLVGMDHRPYCEVKVVRSIDPSDELNFLVRIKH